MFLRSPDSHPFLPFALLVSIVAGARSIAVETWRANARSIRPAPSSRALPVPDGPAGVERRAIAARWAELADWRVWWMLNQDPFLSLKAHVHAGNAETGSDDFYLGHGTAVTGGGAGPASPGPSGPSTPGGTRSPDRGPQSARTLQPGAPGPVDRGSADELEFEVLPPNASVADRERVAAERVARILRSCAALPGERPAAMYFRFWGDNAFVRAASDPLSTFAADVDTASYALARAYLKSGFLPEREAVRTEEFVNYFRPDLEPPRAGDFTLETELAPSRFGASSDDFGGGSGGERWMLRVALRGRELDRAARRPVCLTFVVDTSGSMAQDQRLELVKRTLLRVVEQLDGRDRVAIVGFSDKAQVVLPPTSALDLDAIDRARRSLSSGGGTNAEAGLVTGYQLAHRAFSPLALNRVVLFSDGVANVGETGAERLTEEVRREREAGIFLNAVGVGIGNYGDALLEELADRGDGVCNYVDSDREAHRALVEDFVGAMEPIARDLKVQLEFDPAQVARYRLLGYENRAIADESFRDDRVDAGEVGAGHQVVALYELELARPDAAPLATVRLRWKTMEGAVLEMESPVRFASARSWEASSGGYKRSVVVAQFAELLRGSTHARGDSYEDLAAAAVQVEQQLGDPDFTELLAMIDRAVELRRRPRPAPGPLFCCVDALRRQNVERAQLEEAGIELDPRSAQDLERASRALEARIRELVRESLESGGR